MTRCPRVGGQALRLLDCDVNIGSADPAGFDTNQDFPRPRERSGNLLNGYRPGLIEPGG
jgi:hypothetical protein